MRESSMSTENQENHKKRPVLWGLLMFALMLGSAALVPFLREGVQGIRPVYLVLAVLLSLGAVVYALLFEAKASEGFLFWLIPLVYLISVAFLLLFDNPFTFPFWNFGGLLLLCAFQLRYGMLVNFYLLFLIGGLQTEPVLEVLIIQVLCLLLLGFVMPHAKSRRDAVNILISIAAVLVSARIICYFIMRKVIPGDIFYVAITYAILICAVLLLSKVLQETLVLQGQVERFEFLEELAAGAEDQDANVSEYIALTEGASEGKEEALKPASPASGPAGGFEAAEVGQTALLEALGSENAPLLVQLSQRDPKAFLHARRVAAFASEVSKRVEGLNTPLVKCGGYYHEIGRLRGDKTVEGTLFVARKEGFPAALQNVLREHTVDGDKPTSKEAALLLLTDNICGICEYLKHTQKGKILMAKVIDKAINLRLVKGDFNESGLSVRELSVIRNAMTEVIKEELF